jgi:hypothetical protein
VFDQLGATGVPIPPDFSGPSIMSTVLAIVGIDTPMVTAMLGGEISDPDEAAEAHKELAGVLSGDPKALVALLREEFDPASLLPMIKDAAISFLIQTLITQAAERIAALLVPGGAILQAVEAIFKVLQWVINNAARIFTLIQALVGAAAQAVAGNIAGVAAAVETSLVQIIVVVIDFLTGYLGLGGLGGKLKGVIMKVGGKLKALLKKVLGAVAKRAKARAKTKHHQHAHDKHDDGRDPRNHKHDDDNRDPQKIKDDAKDPRNHQRDPDDKDPRNHQPGADDEDPRHRKPDAAADDPKKHKDDDDRDPKRHKDDDDRDPKRHKDAAADDPKEHKDDDDERDPKKHKDDDDEHDPKKKHEKDLAEARRLARAAANRGWTAARAASEREVISNSELKTILASEEHSTAQARIELEPQDRAKAWHVEAKARVDQAHATDTEGRGWIARGDGGQHWYAADNLSALSHKVIDGSKVSLGEPFRDATGSDDDAIEKQYQAKVSQSENVKAKGQAQLDNKIRGLEFSIKMEPLARAERDHKVTAHFKVTPGEAESSAVYDLGATQDDGEIGKHLRFSAARENHTLWIDTHGARPVVMMASTAKPVYGGICELWQSLPQDIWPRDSVSRLRAR